MSAGWTVRATDETEVVLACEDGSLILHVFQSSASFGARTLQNVDIAHKRSLIKLIYLLLQDAVRDKNVTGTVGWDVYMKYIQAGGSLLFLACFLLAVTTEVQTTELPLA